MQKPRSGTPKLLQKIVIANPGYEDSEILEHGLENDMVFPHFQPIYDNGNAMLTKYESLVRIADERGNIHSPGTFLDVAKKLRVYPRLTRAMVRKTISAMETNPKEFSVNLSYDDFTDALTRELIFSLLDVNKGISQRLTFEILESEGIENQATVDEFIADVKAFGCRVAIDDFGTGYANFDYLVHLDEILSNVVDCVEAHPSRNIYAETLSSFITPSTNVLPAMTNGIVL